MAVIFHGSSVKSLMYHGGKTTQCLTTATTSYQVVLDVLGTKCTNKCNTAPIFVVITRV